MRSWQVRDRVIDFQHTVLMGVINLTPDSFSDGSQFMRPADALSQAKNLLSSGADILDLGAESTRPGADPVTAEEELLRLTPALDEIRKISEAVISIDTTKPAVAQACLERGAHIINDVSGLRDSGPAMAECVREYGAGLVLMHRRGNPKTMQSLGRYENLLEEILAELRSSIKIATDAGVRREQIAIDPGLGFAKSAEDNFQILNQLERFQELGLPVLLGPSRKSFIGKVTGKEVQGREFGTAAACAIAVLKGVQILRVHEPAQMRDAVKVAEAVRGEHYVRTF